MTVRTAPPFAERTLGGVLGGIMDWLKGGSYLAHGLDSSDQVARLRDQMVDAAVVVCVGAAALPATRAALAAMSASRKPMLIVDLAEPVSFALVTRAKSTSGLIAWALRIEATAMRSLEAEAVRAADLTLVAGHSDLQALSQSSPHVKLWTVASGVDVPELSNDATGPDFTTLLPHLIFCGDLSIKAHQRAADWFAAKVMPTIVADHPPTRLRLIGTDLPRSIRRLKSLPFVDVEETDQPMAALRQATQRCVAGVAPQRDARGSDTAVLTMLALCRPVIATRTVALSLPLEAAAAPICAQSGPEFHDASLAVLQDRKTASKAARRGRAIVRTTATWDEQWRRVKVLFAEINANAPVNIERDIPLPARLEDVAQLTTLDQLMKANATG